MPVTGHAQTPEEERSNPPPDIAEKLAAGALTTAPIPEVLALRDTKGKLRHPSDFEQVTNPDGSAVLHHVDNVPHLVFRSKRDQAIVALSVTLNLASELRAEPDGPPALVQIARERFRNQIDRSSGDLTAQEALTGLLYFDQRDAERPHPDVVKLLRKRGLLVEPSERAADGGGVDESAPILARLEEIRRLQKKGGKAHADALEREIGVAYADAPQFGMTLAIPIGAWNFLKGVPIVGAVPRLISKAAGYLSPFEFARRSSEAKWENLKALAAEEQELRDRLSKLPDTAGSGDMGSDPAHAREFDGRRYVLTRAGRALLDDFAEVRTRRVELKKMTLDDYLQFMRITAPPTVDVTPRSRDRSSSGSESSNGEPRGNGSGLGSGGIHTLSESGSGPGPGVDTMRAEFEQHLEGGFDGPGPN